MRRLFAALTCVALELPCPGQDAKLAMSDVLSFEAHPNGHIPRGWNGNSPGATVLFRSQLYGISAIEWTVLLPVGAAMLALSLLAADFSAKPWIAIDPMEAIRHA